MTFATMIDALRPYRFSHDACAGCRFIGQYGAYDVWFCNGQTYGTWIARYGHDGPEYASFPTFVVETLKTRGDCGPAFAAIVEAGA
jgi:hypothetical protein